MDTQTGLICVALVVISALVILLVSMFGIKEKTYEEAIAEQRKQPDDLLLGKREKSKEKKHKNKAGGKKVKEKKEEKEEKEDEKSEHVQFEENPQILTDEVPPQEEKNFKGNKKKGKIEKVKPILINKDEPVVLAPELNPSQPQPEEINHFNLTQPKDDLELVRSQSRENLQQLTQSEPIINKSPKDTPTKSKKNFKEQPKKSAELKDEKKEVAVVANTLQQQAVKEVPKDVKEQPKDTPVKGAKEITKETASASVQLMTKETKNKKKKNDILAQIGGDRDGVNISLLVPLVQKAELSRSEIQILIEQLLNKECDNPLEHSEWTEGRTDQVIKLKKQLSEKEKALADEQEASVAVQNKLKELRLELNAEKSRLSANVRQLEETLGAKVTEAQTLHTRMQHILESHAAEKQGFVRQIEQLQSKVNENVTIIHKMQEDKNQTQGHMQQELVAQGKQLEVQFSQMRDNENSLKAQLAQKHAEVQELQSLNMTLTQETQRLRSTCENNTAENELLTQQLHIMQERLMHSDGHMQHYQEAREMLQENARQLEDSLRARSDLEHKLQNAHRHEQDLQKQINSLKSELNIAKNEASEAANLKAELSKAQAELNELKQSQSGLIHAQSELKNSQLNATRIQKELDAVQSDLKRSEAELLKAQNQVKNVEAELAKTQTELSQIQKELSAAQEELKNSNQTVAELKTLTVEIDRLRDSQKNSSDSQIEISRLQEENNRLLSQSGAVAGLQEEINKLKEENDSLTSQLAVSNERPAAEGRENGLETKAVKSNVQLIEQTNSPAKTEVLLHELQAKVTEKDTELNKLTNELESLQNNTRSQITHLRDELEVQKTKNNELRTKNWKVMEALSAAESRVNSVSGKAIDDLSQKALIEEQKSTEAILQRIFPDISISEHSHDKWLKTFEQKVSSFIAELKENKDISSQIDHSDLEKQNQSLQGMVSHYKQIIDDTEEMLNKLQSHIDSEEARWQAELQQKEETLASLKIELNDLRNKASANEELKRKIYDLETRLSEAEAFKDRTQTELASLKTRHEPSPVKGENKIQNFNLLEQFGEEKARLLQALQEEVNNKASLDAEVARLRSLLETTESSLAEEKNLVSQLNREVSQLKNEVHGGCSSSDQSTVNGPPSSDPSKLESTTAVAESLLAALEKSLKNTEIENCTAITEPKKDLVECDHQEPDTGFLISKTSPQTCQMIEHNTQASWNPLNGQQHKKHKKKRKGGSGKK